MRILYHHRTRGRNVEGIHIREIVKALEELGNKVNVVSPSGVDPMQTSDGDHSALSRTWNWISRRFPQIGFETLELLYNFPAYCNLSRVLMKHGADLIYERYAFFTWAGALTAKRHRIPVILEVNEVSGAERVRGQVLTGLAKSIEERVFGMADAIIVVSDFLKRQIAQYWMPNIGCSIVDRIYVIPNAVDPRKFNPNVDGSGVKKKLGLENRIVIGFVGSFVNWSNLESLVQAFSDISKDRTDTYLMLVGDGPMRESIEGMVAEEDLRHKVIFTGNISHRDIPEFIAAMDICVIPRSNEYRSPVKLFEYMAMGKPVVAPRLEPIEKVVTHGENGILFEQDEILLKKNMKNAIIYLLDKDEMRRRLGDMACQSVLRDYTWLGNARKIMEIYDQISV